MYPRMVKTSHTHTHTHTHTLVSIHAEHPDSYTLIFLPQLDITLQIRV